MKRLITAIFVLFMILATSLRADEGMWIPILIEQFNIQLMQEKGFKLTSEDIYSVNKACMKDAVMIFGGGCTGELISSRGLLITNHHCGYGQIQSHSSLEHDYLTNGFWAMSGAEELPNPGLSVTFLKWMEDVTDKVLDGVTDGMDEDTRDGIIGKNTRDIASKAAEGNNYQAYVRPFYMGNQYFLFVNEVYRDVRLVGAPPSSIGKFGGETDNWVWPRHTGDFSLFRIYADKDNKPAEYSDSNVPYKPAYHFPVSLKGVNEGDFTMVFGYPGRTSQYVPSYHIEMLKDFINPPMIALRDKKLGIMIADMEADPGVRIQYSAKKSGIANSWKRWIGENIGLEKLGAVEKKRDFEAEFSKWVASDGKRQAEYGDILPMYRKIYDEYKIYRLVSSYSAETLGRSGVEAIGMAASFIPLVEAWESGADASRIDRSKGSIARRLPEFFRNYNKPTDKKLFVAMLDLYGRNMSQEWQAVEYKNLYNSCGGDFSKVVDKVYDNTLFADEAVITELLNNFGASSVKKIKKDQLYKLAISVNELMDAKVNQRNSELSAEISTLDRIYMKAQLEFASDRVLWADANSTLRVAYGNVAGYESRDAVYYTHYTTLKGIMEKDNPEIYDYNVPEKLRELYRAGDYGRYAQDGEIPVCFIANNHTTGGNSGSPVINADGHLIGVNFD
ncbi:MAG: S46 family peptidase, partial [Bacteroidia bacterium]